MCLELSVKREKMSCMRVIDGFDPLVCDSRMKAACEPAGIVMTYALVQPSKNLHEHERLLLHPTGSTCRWSRDAKNRFAAGLRVDIS